MTNATHHFPDFIESCVFCTKKPKVSRKLLGKRKKGFCLSPCCQDADHLVQTKGQPDFLSFLDDKELAELNRPVDFFSSRQLAIIFWNRLMRTQHL